MLESFYRQLFRPREATPSLELSVLLAGLILLVMTFNAAGGLGLSASGLSPLLILFGLGGFLGLFWLTAAIWALMSLLGQDRPFGAILQGILLGLWPLLFSGVSIAAQSFSAGLGAILSLLVTLGTVLLVSNSLAQLYETQVWRSLIVLILVILFSFLTLGGLLVWPLMLFLGL